MANVNVNLAGMSLQVFDIVGSFFRVNVQQSVLTLAASVALYESYFPVVSGAGSSITLPATTVWFAVVHNLSATNSVTVQTQATGGALVSAANSLILAPGGIWLYANNSESAGGLVALTLVSNAASSPVEILLAA